jgi:hypothetical protein
MTRFDASAVTLADGRVLLVGGRNTRFGLRPVPLPSTELYDPVSRRWGPAGKLATPRRGFALVALADGGAIVAGGFGGAGLEAVRLSSVERFDPVSNTWSPTGNLPFHIAGATGIRLADEGVLLAGGSVREPKSIDPEAGTYVSGLTAKALLFDPNEGTWRATAPMPSRRAGASAIRLADGSVVIAGGSASEGEVPGTPSCPAPHRQVLRYIPAH